MTTCTHDATPIPLAPEIETAITQYWRPTHKSPTRLMEVVVKHTPDATTACRVMHDIDTDVDNGKWCEWIHMQWNKHREPVKLNTTPPQRPAAPAKKNSKPKTEKDILKAAKKESPVKADDPRAICPVGFTSDYARRYYDFMHALNEYEDNNGKTIFAHGTDVVTVANNQFFTHNLDTFMLEAAQRIRFLKEDDNGNISHTGPQPDLIKTLIAQGNTSALPEVKRAVTTPFFAPDGTLVQLHGYHAASKILHMRTRGFSVHAVPEKPTMEDIEAAKTLLMDDMLGDFPFVSKADKSNAVAFQLNLYAREMIDGPAPLFAFESTTERTGKTLLADVCMIPALGESKMSPAPEERKEWGKSIVATLRESSVVAAFDNANFTVDSGVLASAITAWPMCKSRILGLSENAELPAPAAWLITGNSMKFSSEMAKRTVSIKQDAQMERPEERTGFRHPWLRKWTRENRANIVHANLVLIQAWVSAGRPPAPDAPKFGGFEDWTEVMAGILHTAGIDGFLQNRNEFLDKGDDTSAAWRRFIAQWADSIDLGTKCTAREVLTHVCGATIFTQDGVKTTDVEVPVELGNGGERSITTKFGAALRKHTGRWYGPYRLNAESDGQRLRYWLSTRETGN